MPSSLFDVSIVGADMESKGSGELSDHSLQRSSFCRHATAHGSYVFGIRTSVSSNSSQESGGEEDGIPHVSTPWKTCLDHNVIFLTSNEEGTVVVAATDKGTVSLLRGNDGQVLATRSAILGEGEKVTTEELLLACPMITWVSSVHDSPLDSILIEFLNNTDDVMTSDKTSFVLLSHIDGASLVSSDPQIVSTAAGQIKISQVVVGMDLRAVTASYRTADQSKIRLVGCTPDGSLAVFDHDVTESNASLVQSQIVLENGDGELQKSLLVDFEFGFVSFNALHQVCGETKKKIFHILSAFSSNRKNTGLRLYWFDPETMQIVCSFVLADEKESSPMTPTSRAFNRSKVLAIECLRSHTPDSMAFAVAASTSSLGLASQPGSNRASAMTKLHVVQLVVEESFGLVLLSKPHFLYSISLEETTANIPVELVACLGSPYSVLMKIQSDSQETTYRVFWPNRKLSTCISEIGRLVELGDFGKVDEILRDTSSSIWNESAKYLAFSKSGISRRHLRSLLKSPDENRIEGILNCFRRLADHTVSDNGSVMLSDLLAACDEFVASFLDPKLDDFITILSSMICVLDDVIRDIPRNESIENVQRKKEDLLDRLESAKFLASVVRGSSGLKITQPFLSAKSPAHLFSILLREGKFTVAELLWRSKLRSFLSADVLVRSMLKVTPDIDPALYSNLLGEIVLPSLSIGNELLALIQTWCCSTADAHDDGKLGLEAALVLLEMVDKCTKKLQLRVHSSFAVDSPFVDGTTHAKRGPFHRRKDPNISDSLDDVTAPSISSRRLRSTNGMNTDGFCCVPTILQLGALTRGAGKLRLGSLSTREETTDRLGEFVEEKLRHARCLRSARNAGLNRKTISLKDFSERGGFSFVAQQLISIAVTQGIETPSAFISTSVKPFCLEFGVDFDDILLEWVADRCGGKQPSARGITESDCILRSCTSDITKARAALLVLQAALICGSFPKCLSRLSCEAVQWASADSILLPEVQEASRLILIDSIICKYCGSGARELFRVDNPRHAVRLVEFVARHIEEKSVLADALSLCDAFTHLDPRNVCSSVLCNAVLRGDEMMCVSFMQEMLSRDESLGESTLARVLIFTEELLRDISSRLVINKNASDVDDSRSIKDQAKGAVACAKALVELILLRATSDSSMSPSPWQEFSTDLSLEQVRAEYARVSLLQGQFLIFPSISNLSSASYIIETLEPLVQSIVDDITGNGLKGLNTNVARARRACSLLVGGSNDDSERFWVTVCASAASKMVGNQSDAKVCRFMETVGLFGSRQDRYKARAILTVALALCLKAEGVDSVEGMQRVTTAVSFLRDRILFLSTDLELPVATFFGSIIETAYEILVRADEGQGELLEVYRKSLRDRVWGSRLPPSRRQKPSSTCLPSVSLPRPRLHESWYVGDGLLLPPTEALSYSVRFCRNVISYFDTSCDVVDFLRSSGAHFLSQRVLSTSVACLLSAQRFSYDPNFSDLMDMSTNVNASIVERSLGGSCQIGLTSGVVDSQLAAVFLLALPVKKGFVVYKSSLPTALKAHDFERVSALASVGFVSCYQSEGDVEGIFLVGWKGQQRFLNQCRQLLTRSHWWAALQRLGVVFETQKFLESVPEDVRAPRSDISFTTSSSESQYVVSLLLRCFDKLTPHQGIHETLRWCSRFGHAFGVSFDTVVQKFVEWILTPATDFSANERVRLDLVNCEKIVRKYLPELKPAMKRSAVLRRCLVRLETSPDATQDYERLALVLALYHESLISVVEEGSSVPNFGLDRFETELDLIDRRRDVIAILSSYFCGTRFSHRPNFTSLFQPLQVPFLFDRVDSEMPVCGVLGNIRRKNESAFDPFDPLECLHNILGESNGQEAAAALDSLCLSLGLPRGYIQSRALIIRFVRASDEKMVFPSFEHDVLPVVDRLKSASDRMELMEWCSSQYGSQEDDRLKCLDLALQAAITVSSELENNVYPPSAEKLADALEAVKRISEAKAALSDVLRVKAILRSGIKSHNGWNSSIIDEILGSLNNLSDSPEPSPEALIDLLLTGGSRLTADKCLDSSAPISTGQLRELCSLVHDASNAVASQYSHIRVADLCRKLAREWLFYGDVNNSPSAGTISEAPSSHINMTSTQCDEDTTNFVMDIADLQDNGDVMSFEQSFLLDSLPRTCSSEEEPSIFTRLTSRETSELASTRAALRIAFVLAFDDTDQQGNPLDSENAAPLQNVQPKGAPTKKLLGKLETKVDSRKDERVVVMSRELLRIVFAKSEEQSLLYRDSRGTLDAGDSEGFRGKVVPETLTFAMRHRALRAASILCPQEALDRIVSEEQLMGGSARSLKECAFGVFLAKEIEEMGLPLPHSDLGQLSGMHFPSYARALWRDHRGMSRKRCHGRLLLLLVELALRGKPEDTVDTNLVDSLLTEILKLKLPRTLLLAVEKISAHEKNRSQCGFSVLPTSIGTVTVAIISEASEFISETASPESDYRLVLDSIERFGTALTSGHSCDETTPEVAKFMEQLKELSQAAPDHIVSERLTQVWKRSQHHLRLRNVNIAPDEGPREKTDHAIFSSFDDAMKSFESSV